MNLQLTPEQARAQLAGLQKQKDVVDKSIKMLAYSGTTLQGTVDSGRVTIDLVAGALATMLAVQVLALGLQQEALAAQIAMLENALRGGGIVLPTFLGPERKT